MEATLESIGEIVNACIDYIEQNAVWLGIAFMAVLVLLVLIGSLSAAGRARKQTRVLRRIDKKMEELLAVQEQNAQGGQEEPSLEETAVYEDAVERFFEGTMIETCYTAAPEAPAAEQPAEKAPAEEEIAAEVPAEEPAEEDPAESAPAEEVPDFPDLREALSGGSTAARGRSGRLYTREELENQIRK